MKCFFKKNAISLVFNFLFFCNLNFAFALDAAEPTQSGLYKVAGNWSELKRGWNILQIQIMDVNQVHVQVESLDIIYDMIEMPMSPPNKEIIAKGDGLYEKRIFLGMTGKWKFDVKIANQNQQDEFNKIHDVR